MQDLTKETIIEENNNSKKTQRICSDYDEDCKECNHITCFLGNGVLPIADGICPFLHKTS